MGIGYDTSKWDSRSSPDSWMLTMHNWPGALTCCCLCLMKIITDDQVMERAGILNSNSMHEERQRTLLLSSLWLTALFDSLGQHVKHVSVMIN